MTTSDAGKIKEQIVEMERAVLRAMCGGSLAPAQIKAAREALREYAWRDEEHRVVFEALARMRNADAIPLRQQLPAHATRMGFPDVDWPLYFDPISQRHTTQNFDLEELLRQLLQLTGHQ
jgi:hypothetical protein